MGDMKRQVQQKQCGVKPLLEVSEANLQGLGLKVVKVHSQMITHFKSFN